VSEVTGKDIVLPEWHAGDPCLSILPPIPDKNWHVSINLGDGIEEHVDASESFVVALPHAGRFDIRMELEVAGKVCGRRDFEDLMVTGRIEVETPKPR
jgi:hypothetical protein